MFKNIFRLFQHQPLNQSTKDRPLYTRTSPNPRYSRLNHRCTVFNNSRHQNNWHYHRRLTNKHKPTKTRMTGMQLTPITLSLLALTTVFATATVLREYQQKTQAQACHVQHRHQHRNQHRHQHGIQNSLVLSIANYRAVKN